MRAKSVAAMLLGAALAVGAPVAAQAYNERDEVQCFPVAPVNSMRCTVVRANVVLPELLDEEGKARLQAEMERKAAKDLRAQVTRLVRRGQCDAAREAMATSMDAAVMERVAGCVTKVR